MFDSISTSSYSVSVPSSVTHDIFTKTKNDSAKLRDLAQIDTGTIFRCQSVFPIDFFPDTLVVNSNKISVTTRFSFFSKQVHSLLISDVLTAIVEEGIFFATLRVVDRQFNQETITVEHLFKSDAKRARRLIEGLVIATKEKIDFSKIPTGELKTMLEKIGQTKTN